MKPRFRTPLSATSLKKCFYPHLRHAAVFCATILSFTATSSLEAAIISWDGGTGGTGTDLGTATNWNGDVLPNVATPDTAEWNGAPSGPLALVYSTAAYAGSPGNVGLGLSVLATAAQTPSLNIDSGANVSALRMNNITLAAGSGTFSLGNALDTFNITLGGVTNALSWINNASTSATVATDVKFANGGAADHVLTIGGSGNWDINTSLTSTNGGLITLAKTGNGTLNLTGTSVTTGPITVAGGIVRLTGTHPVAGTTTVPVSAGILAGTNGILQIDGGTLNAAKTTSPSLAAGTVAGSNGFIKMTTGTLTTGNELHLGRGTGAYAAMSMSGGSVTSANWLVVGLNNDKAVLNQSGGSITVSTNRMTVGAGGAGSVGVVNLSGGTFTDNIGIFVGENGTGTVNISGSSAASMGNLQFGGAASSLAGTVNLLGGTLSAGSITKGTGSGVYLMNFNGGTLSPTATNASFFANLANTSAYVYGGGALINTNGFDATISQPLLAPAGSGVNSIASFTPGAGYIDTPVVVITPGSGDTTGIGATAVANVSGGVVTGITITNPGTGYTAVPTFTLSGGGATTAATVTGTAPTANTSGGLVKSGAGTLTLGGVNTYTGPTSVTTGTLNLTGVLGSAGGTAISSATNLIQASVGSITGSSSLAITAGTANLAGTNTYTGATTITGGTLTVSGTGGIDNSSGITLNGSGAKFLQTSGIQVLAPVILTNGTLDGTTTLASVTVGNGTGGVITHGNGGFEPLAIENLTFTGAATLNLNVNSTATIIPTTTLTTNAAGVVTINATNASWTTGSNYNLISYSGGSILGGGFARFAKGTITGLGARQAATLVNTGSVIRLNITGDTPVWSGALNSSWTTGVLGAPKNWRLQTANTTTDFQNNDAVLFSDAASGTTAVNISTANVNTSSITFSNSTAKTYSISSGGGFGIASGSILKTGDGVVSLNTANTYAGGTTLNLGTLNINNASAIGTGTFLMNGGSIDNTSGSPVALTTNNSQTWNTNLEFGGTNSLDLGTGAVAIATDTTITTNGTGNLTLGGTLGAGTSHSIIKDGTGSLTLGGANTYSGITNFTSGNLNLNNASAIGTGAFFLAGSSLDNTSGAAVALTTNNTQSWDSDFTFTGSNNLSFGTGTASFGADRTVTVSANTLSTGRVTGSGSLIKQGAGTLGFGPGGASTVSGDLAVNEGKIQIGLNDFTAAGLTGTGTVENGSGTVRWLVINNTTDKTFAGVLQDGTGGAAMGFRKGGTGTLTLTGANTYNDQTTVNSGKLIFSGITNNIRSANIIGDTAGMNAVLAISPGATFGSNFNGANTSTASMTIGSSATAAGTVQMSDPTSVITVNRQLSVGPAGNGSFSQSGGSTTIGGFLAVGATASGGVVNHTGGTITNTTAAVTLGYGVTAASAVMNLGGNAVFNTNGAAGSGFWVGEIGTAVLNVSGSSLLSIPNDGVILGRANTTLSSGTVNLRGGTILTKSISKGTGTGNFNFNGGTLKANSANETFMQGLTSAYVRSGGAIIDTDTFDITIGQQLLAPTGSGVSASGLTVSGGGFIDTPIVMITGDGTGATAVATIDGAGNLTGITVTNPGTGYSTPPAFALVGGGIGNTGVIGGTATLVTSNGGGLTKTGTGKLTLTSVNTYKGDTTVTGGTLGIGISYLADAADVRLSNGAVLDLTFAAGTPDTIDELYIDGVQQASGTWGAVGSGAAHTSPRITGTGVLNVTTGTASSSGYASWATSKGLTGANNGATQDPDFDGISNLLEFILGGNPLASGTSILPTQSLTTNDFIFTFNRADESETETTQIFQYGSTLAGWTNVAIGANSAGQVTIVENGASADTVTVTIPRTSEVGGKLFGRLNATK
ncbi:MAG: autotransporter-associated beta strand repeat-containing protein [Verrucomicrobiota bacterium]